MAKFKKVIKDTHSVAQTIEDKLNECNDAYTRGAFKYLRFLVHLLGVLQFGYALYFFCNHLKLPTAKTVTENSDWGGRFKFLTFLNVILQTVYHGISLLNDLFGSNALNPEPKPILRQFKDYVYAVLAFPVSFNVCVCFWGVYAFDRELIFPRALDAFFPNWLNHVVHTNIAMLIILDCFLCYRSYPRRSAGILSTSFFMLLYLGWMHIVRYHAGRWAYPLFDVLDWPMRYVMLFGIVFVSLIFYMVGEFMNNLIWAPEKTLLSQKDKLKTL